jgi:hypothetical protein
MVHQTTDDHSTDEHSADLEGRAPLLDAQDRAEELDDNTVRLDPNGSDDPGLPGLNATTGVGPMQSEDPSLLLGGSETRDEIHTRTWRERPEPGAGEPISDAEPAGDLVTPADAEEFGRDVEKTMVGEAATGHADSTPTPAEVDAIRLVESEAGDL